MNTFFWIHILIIFIKQGESSDTDDDGAMSHRGRRPGFFCVHDENILHDHGKVLIEKEKLQEENGKEK